MSSWSEPRMRGRVLRGIPADDGPGPAPAPGPVLRGVTPTDDRPPAPPEPEPVPIDLAVVRSRAARELVVDPSLVEESLEEGYRMGYDAGFQTGLGEASAAIAENERAREEQLQTAMASLHEAVVSLQEAAAELRRRETTVREQLEDQIVAAAFAIAEMLVGYELRHTEQRGRDALARALAFAPEAGYATARLNPDDAATVGDVSDLALGRELQIVADPSLSPGDCVVEIEAFRVDARIGAALERIREVLGP